MSAGPMRIVAHNTAACDLFVLPSRSEGMRAAMTEAITTERMLDGYEAAPRGANA